jgi:hypothetical protein
MIAPAAGRQGCCLERPACLRVSLPVVWNGVTQRSPVFGQHLRANLKENQKMLSLFRNALIAVVVAGGVAFAADNTLGTWKLNIDKSKYTPEPMPVKSLTVMREAADGGVKVTTTGEQASGTTINASYTTKYDGKDAQVTGNAPYDFIAIKQVNANTLTDERKKTGGPYRATARMVISNGGKTMTTITKGTNAEGKEFTSTFVFDKQ